MPQTDDSHASSPRRSARPGWRRSTFSYEGECVELADLGDGIGVRDSKEPGGDTLNLTRQQVAGWIAAIKAGDFDDLA